MANKKRFPILFVLLGLFIPVFSLLIVPKADAAVNATVVDRAHIKIGERMFADNDIDDTFKYTEQSPTDRCADIIEGFDNGDLRGNNVPSSATIKVKTPKPNNDNDCNTSDDTVNFSSNSRANFRKAFLWVDPNTIKGADGKMTFTRDGTTNTFRDANSEDRCVDTLVINSNNTSATLHEREYESNGNHEYDWYPFTITDRDKNDDSGCYESEAVSGVQLAGTPDAGNEAGVTGGPGEGVSADNSCESKGGAIGWILCPLIITIEAGLNWVDSQIQRLLTVDKGYYDNPDIREAWGNIRNVAYSLLVPIMLVMVISTALGFEFISAYTVKRALPRVIAAAIFIALSYPICVFLIEFFNAIGNAVMGFLTYPFDDASNLTLASMFNGGIFGTLTQIAGTVGLIIVLLFFGGTLLLFAGIAFLVLMVRQMLIVAFLLLAPVAILSWIFPGNDKLWKFWWDTFSKMLIMFPMIMGLLAMGRIFAFVIKGSNPAGFDGTVLQPVMTLVAYVLPYGMIPFTFKLAGGAIATFAGMTDRGGKGLFAKQAERRGAKWDRWKTDGAFKNAGDKGIRARVNRGMVVGANLKHAGLRPSGWRGGVQSAIADKEWDHGAKAAEEALGGKSYWANDDLISAGMAGDGRGKREDIQNYLAGKGMSGRQLEIATSQVMRMRRSMGSDAYALQALARLPATGTAYVGEDGIGKWYQDVAKYTHGNKSLQGSLVAAAKAGFGSAQRTEVSEASFGDHMNAIQMAEGFNPKTKQAQQFSTQDISRHIADGALQGGGVRAVVGTRNADSAKVLAGALKRNLEAAYAAPDVDENGVTKKQKIANALVAISNVRQSMGGSRGPVSEVLSTEVMGHQVEGRAVVDLISDPTIQASEEWKQAKYEFTEKGAAAKESAETAAGVADEGGLGGPS